MRKNEKTGRMVFKVCLVEADAESQADTLRETGRKVRVYPRTVSAEGIATQVYAVVGDIKSKYDQKEL